jgi:hypothetical protein
MNQEDEKVSKIINYFELSETSLLFFDIFYKNNKIFLIMPIYNEPPDHDKIFVNVDNNRLKLAHSYVKDIREPILIYVYNYVNNKEVNQCIDSYNTSTPGTPCTPNDIINVEVVFNDIANVYSLKHICTTNETKKILTITTLFKDDYKLFPLFYNYYKNQGVSHFYMYYNGRLTKEIEDIFVKYDDVTLIEWFFHYWNPSNCKYYHHAQLGQLHHAIHRYGKDMCEYMTFCDFDEYLHIPFEMVINNTNDTLIKFIQNNPTIEIFGFCNIWAETLNKEYTITNKLPNKILTNNEIYTYSDRSKNIYKISSINTIGIHQICDESLFLYSNITNLHMYHFYRFSNNNRIIMSKRGLVKVNTETILDNHLLL